MARNSLLRHSDKLAFSDYKLLKAHTSALPILTHTHPCLNPLSTKARYTFSKSLSHLFFYHSFFLSLSLYISFSLLFHTHYISLSLSTFPFLFPSLLLSLSQNLSFFLSHYLYISFSHSFLLLSSFFILTFPLLFLSLHLPFFFLFLTLFNFLAEKLSTKNEK